MNIIYEKHGYIDLKSILLDDITDKVYNIIVYDKGFKNSYTYKNKGETIIVNKENSTGLLFSDFTVKLNHSKLNKLKVIVVNVTDYDIVTNLMFDIFLDEDKISYAFFSISYSTDDIGYIYINYNAYKDLPKNMLKSELKNTIYHEIRHYFDDIVDLIPKSNKNTMSTLPHYIEELGSMFLDINYSVTTTRARDGKEFGSLPQLLYMLNPTELNAFYHSFIIKLEDYIKDNPTSTYKDILLYIKDMWKTDKDNISFIYSFYPHYFNTEEKYKNLILDILEAYGIKAYIFYLVITLQYIKHNDNDIDKENNKIKRLYLHNMSVYDDIELSKKEAEYIIKDYIQNYYIRFVYYRTHKYIFNIVKNINKVIADLTN